MPTEGSFVAIIYRQHILLAERADGMGLNCIGGRVEAGETPEEAAVREAKKETGLDVFVRLPIGEGYPLVSDKGEILDISRIYFAYVEDGKLAITEESSGFVWVSLGNLDRLNIVKRPCPGYPDGRTYAMIVDALMNVAYRNSFAHVAYEDAVPRSSSFVKSEVIGMKEH